MVDYCKAGLDSCLAPGAILRVLVQGNGIWDKPVNPNLYTACIILFNTYIILHTNYEAIDLHIYIYWLVASNIVYFP